jgi:hypothetical protein
MTPAFHGLPARRAALVARSAAQRAQILAQVAPVARKLAAADRVVAALRAHPLITAIAAACLALIGPGKVLRWALRVVPIYSFLRP